MSILNDPDAQAILKKVLGFSKADECQAVLNGAREGNVRFARSNVSTSGGTLSSSLVVQASFGKKTGTATINEFDDASLAKVVRRAEDLARLAPENPEYVEFLGPQKYEQPKSWFDSTANIDPAFRAKATAASILPCREKKLIAAGFFEDRAGFTAIANSKGLRGYHRSTSANFSVTVRTADDKGSGYGVADVNDIAKLDTGRISQTAIQKALASVETRSLEPGKYTVILEPAASVDLLSILVSSMNARQADEGRSFLSKAAGETRLGEKLMDERVHISSDHLNPDVPSAPWSSDGRPRRPVDWIKGGVVTNLSYSRFWGRKKGIENEGHAPLGEGFGGGGGRGVAAFEGTPGFIMGGGNESLEELVKGVKRGILVTRMWYIRPVDPQTLLFTGLTRDGTFYVENGKVEYAIKNFRFNESPVIMLNNIEALGKPQRANGSLVPPMVIRDFTFSSLSDAV